MDTQIIRKIDELGRVVLPTDMRNRAGLQSGDEVLLTQEEDGCIVLTTARGRCALCGQQESESTFKGAYLCNECIARIKAM